MISMLCSLLLCIGSTRSCFPKMQLIFLAAIDLVKNLLVVDAAKRLTAAQAQQHPWMTVNYPFHGTQFQHILLSPSPSLSLPLFPLFPLPSFLVCVIFFTYLASHQGKSLDVSKEDDVDTEGEETEEENPPNEKVVGFTTLLRINVNSPL